MKKNLFFLALALTSAVSLGAQEGGGALSRIGEKHIASVKRKPRWGN